MLTEAPVLGVFVVIGVPRFSVQVQESKYWTIRVSLIAVMSNDINQTHFKSMEP
jgi:hypothetical protein